MDRTLLLGLVSMGVLTFMIVATGSSADGVDNAVREAVGFLFSHQ